jgi:hypothetical protein
VTYRNIQHIPGFAGPSPISAGGPYTISEGQSLTLDGSATAAPGTQLLGIAWDLNGDGYYADAVDESVTYPTTTATSQPTVTWAELEALGLTHAGTYPIGMQVFTTTGAFYAFTTLVIDATRPVIDVNTGAGGSANVGEPYTIGFSPTFPGDEQPTGFVVNWGDGTSTTLPSDATTATHVYTKVGTDQLTVSVMDVNGATTSPEQTITVGVDPNSVRAGSPYVIDAGSTLTLVAMADGLPSQAKWDLLGIGTYTDDSGTFVDNGDGASTSTLTLTWAQLQALGITDSGVFSNVTVEAIYPTSVVPAGFLTSAATTLTVNDVAPTATLSGTALEGGPGSVTFSNQASFVQTSGFLYSYDVGNTGTFQVSDSSGPTFTVPTSDLYQSGSLVVRGRITDKHGLFTDSIITFPIADQAPTIVTIDGDKTVNENAVVSLTNVTVSDPGQDVLTASIDWGDGTTSQGVVTTTSTNPAPTTGTVSGSHAYAYQAAPYVVMVTVQDADGATDSKSFQVTVLDPPLTVSASPDQTVNEGGVVNLTGATFSDPGAPDIYTATVDWGDGSAIDVAPAISPPRVRGRPGAGVRLPRLRPGRRLRRHRLREGERRHAGQQHLQGYRRERGSHGRCRPQRPGRAGRAGERQRHVQRPRLPRRRQPGDVRGHDRLGRRHVRPRRRDGDPRQPRPPDHGRRDRLAPVRRRRAVHRHGERERRQRRRQRQPPGHRRAAGRDAWFRPVGE